MQFASRLGALVLLLLTCACGSGSTPPPAPTDLTGAWFLTLVHGPVDDDPIHVTMVQTGSAVTATLSCNGDFPTGAGTYTAGHLTVTFDLGGSDMVVLDATATGPSLFGTYTAPGDSGSIRLDPTPIVLDCAHACDPFTVTKFVSTDFTELVKIEEISLLRSAAGHDYVDGCESCRSMKHYFAPYPAFAVNGTIEVRSPVDGIVVSISNEGHGASIGLENKQIHIRSSLHPEYTFIFFHMDLVSAAIAPGKVVTAGELVAHARLEYPDLNEVAHDFDIAVRYRTPYGGRYVSYFDVMTDALFATYQARGVSTRADLVLTAAQRDADPLTCLPDETFTSFGTLPIWFVLGP